MSERFDAKATAKRLTKAQRYAVKRGGISDENTITIKILLAEMLFYREPTPGTTCYTMELTKFGRSVQELLS
jgi:hypothetical protein